MIMHCRAGIIDFVQSLPMRFGTIVSDTYGGLSGGQKQRILLARALCGSPRVLVLDEATSALDTATENVVLAAIKALGISTILFTHRRDCSRIADRTYDMSDLVNLSSDSLQFNPNEVSSVES